jgi:hypothetical protein
MRLDIPSNEPGADCERVGRETARMARAMLLAHPAG